MSQEQRQRGAMVWGLWLALSVVAAHGQAPRPPATDIPLLRLNQPLERTIQAGAKQEYRISVKVGQFVQVEAMQRGVDVVLTLFAPDGKQLIRRNSPNGIDGPEVVSHIAEAGGVYRIQVSVLATAEVKEGRYMLTFQAQRGAVAADQRRLEAETLFQEAVNLEDQGLTLDDVRRAEEANKEIGSKYRASALLWRQMGEKYWQALALENIGLAVDWEEAAQLYEAGGYQQKAFWMWWELGNYYVRKRIWQQAQRCYDRGIALAQGSNDAELVRRARDYVASMFIEQAREAQSLGRTDEALAKLLDTIEFGKTHGLKWVQPRVHNEIGQLYYNSGDLSKAWGSYNQALTAAKSVGDFFQVVESSKNLTKARRKRQTGVLTAELVVQTGHVRLAEVVAFAPPEGKILASGSWDGTIRLWDVANGTLLKALASHNKSLSSIAFTPDGKTFASSYLDGIIELWDTASGTQLRTFANHANGVLTLAFAPDGKTLASGDYEGVIKLWDVANGQELRTLTSRTGLNSVVFAPPEGKILASGNGDGSIQLWDVASGTALKTLLGHTNVVSTMAFASDGKTLTSGASGNAKIWDVASGTMLKSLSIPRPPRSFGGDLLPIAFTSDGQTLAVRDGEGNLRLWDVASGRVTNTRFGIVMAATFAPDGKTLASGSVSGIIKLWDVAEGTELRTLTNHAKAVETLGVALDGKILATSGWDGTIQLWDVSNGTRLGMLAGHSKVVSIVFAPDGKTMASKDDGGTVKLWDIASRQETLLSNPLPVWAQFNSSNYALTNINEQRILFYPESGQINVINYDTGELLGSLIALDEEDWALVTPDGQFDASPGGMKLMHFVVSGLPEGYLALSLEQLKERYFQPGLLPKILGFDKTPRRDVPPFTGADLPPQVEYQIPPNDPDKLHIILRNRCYANRCSRMGEVAILLNGVTRVNDARPSDFNPTAQEASFTFDLKTIPAKFFLPGADANKIEVVAYNADNRVTSPRGSRVAPYTARDAPTDPPQLWVISVGTSDYAGTQLDLQAAAKDAKDFAHAVEVGGKRLFAGRFQLRLLTSDSTDPQMLPTKDNLRRVFAEFRQAKPNDMLLLFFSGHGVALRPEGNRLLYAYLTQTASSSDLSDPAVLQRDALTFDELQEWMKPIPPRKNILIFDTCNAGAVVSDIYGAGYKKDGDNQYRDSQQIAMSILESRMGFHILMGSAADKPSYETNRYRQGLLTRALLEGVKAKAVDEFTNIVNVQKLFQYARNRVPQLASDINLPNPQQPQIAAPGGDDLPLLLMGAAERDAIPLADALPLLQRPRFLNENDEFDDALEKAFIRTLHHNPAGPRRAGEPGGWPFVYVGELEAARAYKPKGKYRVAGNTVTVTLKLESGPRTLGPFSLTGDVGDLPGLAQSILARITEELAKLPKPAQ